MKNDIKKHENIQKVTLLSLIPGVGYIYLKRYVRAVITIITTLLFGVMLPTLLEGIQGLITLQLNQNFRNYLGDNNQVYFGRIAMVYGLIMFVLLGAFVLLYIVTIADCRYLTKQLNRDGYLPAYKKSKAETIDRMFPYLMIVPAWSFFVFFVIIPIISTILIAFTNFQDISSGGGFIKKSQLLDPQWTFSAFNRVVTDSTLSKGIFESTVWTIIWTLGATLLPMILGILLAVTVNQKDFRAKKIFRPIYILPWAVPAFVTLIVFKLSLQPNGVINAWIFKPLGFTFSWDNALHARTGLILIQTWLGFAFVFLMATGVLQSISEDLYEAARIDGASRKQSFRNITFPLLLAAAGPVLITQFSFNFNNFNAIFLTTNGGTPALGSAAGPTDIIISFIFRLVQGQANPDFAVASVITIASSLFIILLSLGGMLRSSAFKESDN
ncbi:MAG: ABC transporter permease subunit [Culicoidibacterales bacterium]